MIFGFLLKTITFFNKIKFCLFHVCASSCLVFSFLWFYPCLLLLIYCCCFCCMLPGGKGFAFKSKYTFSTSYFNNLYLNDVKCKYSCRFKSTFYYCFLVFFFFQNTAPEHVPTSQTLSWVVDHDPVCVHAQKFCPLFHALCTCVCLYKFFVCVRVWCAKSRLHKPICNDGFPTVWKMQAAKVRTNICPQTIFFMLRRNISIFRAKKMWTHRRLSSVILRLCDSAQQSFPPGDRSTTLCQES